ncbi:Protein arginine N-methyltransferase [Pleurostoma richardsiae]|uniref:Protein arginine N-methyltransferase n=1 Tax=Pleurostoma richardsiae TaxID=41990 RepID=A0AA38RWZ9_9PEZI|nr:Protein arginine N-methyltransferase [Pleurostoma richardsiae]
MASYSNLNPESNDFHDVRPNFYIGQHDSSRFETLTDDQYSEVLQTGFNFTTAPITNKHLQERVVALYKTHLKELGERGLSNDPNRSIPVPVVPTLTDEDTSLFPGGDIANIVAYSSPWLDLCSSNNLISNISRQVLNLEVAYANFCGVRSVIIPGPRTDNAKRVAQYARAIQETFLVATRVNVIIHMPMYREPGLEEKAATLSTLLDGDNSAEEGSSVEVDLFGAWDTWNTVRSLCKYTMRLFVALRIPRRLPEKELQTRWFAEPLHYLSFGPQTFQENKAGHPSLSRYHQELINAYMRLKNAPWFILYDVGPSVKELDALTESRDKAGADFPSLSEAHNPAFQKSAASQINHHVSYMRHVERQQPPLTALETGTLTTFQDWLQSPLQPLSDNLESATYEMFEGDPVKYNLYEEATAQAMAEWKELKKPTSSIAGDNQTEPELVVAVAGAGRGPLVTRAIRASERTGTKIQLWALEKNQNAYVYLLRQNKLKWGGKVKVIKTDMRDWPGPIPEGYKGDSSAKVDILITELLGSFGDNELSPECLDGIQKHIARPHGISIPHSYTAWLSPISTPRIHTDLSTRVVSDPNAFETPWVVRLFALDFVSQKVPDHARFQQAWEFAHPVPQSLIEDWEAKHGRPAPTLRTAGAGAMHGSGGTNEHNARHCHLTFYCRPRGVIHGLAGYFESTLYKSQIEEERLVELSTLPDMIDRKSKDMISWFPIFFPLKDPLYFPKDSELEVSMWRQTDDTRVWYEWLVEVLAWVGPNQRVKVGSSELHSSRKVACLM